MCCNVRYHYYFNEIFIINEIRQEKLKAKRSTGERQSAPYR